MCGNYMLWLLDMLKILYINLYSSHQPLTHTRFRLVWIRWYKQQVCFLMIRIYLYFFHNFFLSLFFFWLQFILYVFILILFWKQGYIIMSKVMNLYFDSYALILALLLLLIFSFLVGSHKKWTLLVSFNDVKWGV